MKFHHRGTKTQRIKKVTRKECSKQFFSIKKCLWRLILDNVNIIKSRCLCVSVVRKLFSLINLFILGFTPLVKKRLTLFFHEIINDLNGTAAELFHLMI